MQAKFDLQNLINESLLEQIDTSKITTSDIKESIRQSTLSKIN